MFNSKRSRTSILFGLLAIALVFVLGVYQSVSAQQEAAVVYIEGYLKEQGVQVLQVQSENLLNRAVLIVLQSESRNDKVVPEDPIHLNVTRRAVMMANRTGHRVGSMVLILLNIHGDQIYWAQEWPDTSAVNPAGISQAALDNFQVQSRVAESLDLHGMSASTIEVMSLDQTQQLALKLHVTGIDVANKALPDFIPSLQPLIENINKTGGNITNCIVEIRDEKGILLLNYSYDVYAATESWWMADGVTQDWFPHPPPNEP